MKTDINPPKLTIYVFASPNKPLMDLRYGHKGLTFGNLVDVARHYGIQAKQLPTCIEFNGPKPRIRMFVEKLHFSRTMYRYQQPFHR